MGEQTKNLLIGIFTCAAIVLAVSIIMFLKPSVGDGKEILYVRFSNINKITIGTRVVFAGKPVGEVVAIKEIQDARAQPTDSIGRVYFYELTLKVDSHVKVYNTDQISLQTSGLLGEKSIAIVPVAPPKGVTPKLITNEPIYAESVDPIENAFVELSQLANDMEITFNQINDWFAQNEDNLSSAIHSFDSSMQELQKTLCSINELHLVGDVKSALTSFSITMCDIHQAFFQMQQKHFFTNLGDISSDIKSTTHSIAQGQGTLGRLLKTDDLYLRISSLLSKADTLMNDINHYGILFHLNKGWQRTRTKRMNFLETLDNPCSFKNYFETEVDTIQTSMSRLSLLVDKAEESPEKETILHSTAFKKDFAELLRQSEALSEHLQLFNEELEKASNPCEKP